LFREFVLTVAISDNALHLLLQVYNAHAQTVQIPRKSKAITSTSEFNTQKNIAMRKPRKNKKRKLERRTETTQSAKKSRKS